MILNLFLTKTFSLKFKPVKIKFKPKKIPQSRGIEVIIFDQHNLEGS